MQNLELAKLKKEPTKKEIQKEVFEKLSDSLFEYRGNIKEKKFENKLKKASKLFATDIIKAQKKLQVSHFKE